MRKFAIEVKIIKSSNTHDFKGLLLSGTAKTCLINRSFTHKAPRRKSGAKSFIKQSGHSIDKVRYVKKLYVPTSNNVDILFRPKRNKFCQQIQFITALIVNYIVIMYFIFTSTKYMKYIFHLDSNGRNWFTCSLRVRKTIFGTGFDINICYNDFTQVIRNCTFKIIRYKTIVIISITIDRKIFYTIIFFYKFSSLFDRATFHRSNIISIEGREFCRFW